MLLTKKVTILDKYFKFADVFLKQKALRLEKQIELNKHTIELENSKQLFYKLIYSLGLIKLEILKTYIKIYLKSWFIWPSKSPVGAFILFNKKSDSNFWLYIDY